MHQKKSEYFVLRLIIIGAGYSNMKSKPVPCPVLLSEFLIADAASRWTGVDCFPPLDINQRQFPVEGYKDLDDCADRVVKGPLDQANRPRRRTQAADAAHGGDGTVPLPETPNS